MDKRKDDGSWIVNPLDVMPPPHNKQWSMDELLRDQGDRRSEDPAFGDGVSDLKNSPSLGGSVAGDEDKLPDAGDNLAP